jgi:hypothetical protein
MAKRYEKARHGWTNSAVTKILALEGLALTKAQADEIASIIDDEIDQLEDMRFETPIEC